MKISKVNIIAVICLVFVVGFAIVSTVCFSSFGRDWKVQSVFSEISSTDQILIDLDTAINDSVNNDDLNINTEEIDSAKEKLENIDTETDNAICTGYANLAVKYRLEMIDYGMQVYGSAKEAAEVISAINECNDLISESDTLLKDTSEILVNNNVSQFEEALNKSKRSKELVEQIGPKLDIVANSKFDLDISFYKDYLNTKTEAVNHSISLCQGVIDNNIEFVKSELQVCISLNQQASQKEANLTTNPKDIVRVKFDLENKTLIDKYKQSRKQAAENDSVIRNYLGK